MSLRTWLLEGTAGAAVSTANSGATQVTPNTGTIVYATDAKSTGSTGIRFTSGASQVCIARFAASTASPSMAFEAAVTLPPTKPPADCTLATLRHASGVVARFLWGVAGGLYVESVSGGGRMTLLASPTGGASYRVAMTATVDTATTGRLSAAIYSPSATSTTPLNSVSSTAMDLGTAPIVACDLGVVTAMAAATTVGWDDLRLDDGRTTFIGPYTVPTTPIFRLDTGGTLTPITVSSL